MRYLLVSYRVFSKKHKRIKQCARAPQNTIHSPQYPLTNIFMLLINFIPLKISKSSLPFIFVGIIFSLWDLCTGNPLNNISWITYTMDFYIFKNFSDFLSHMFDKPTKFIQSLPRKLIELTRSYAYNLIGSNTRHLDGLKAWKNGGFRTDPLAIYKIECITLDLKTA